MTALEKLQKLKSACKKIETPGLDSSYVESFLTKDARLEEAINIAYEKFQEISQKYPDLLSKSEVKQIEDLQTGFVNFYQQNAKNPYIAIAACGPWIITSCGAVIHDSGGYGMLGFGHAPAPILDSMKEHHVMANIMTASFVHNDFIELVQKEIGHTRSGSYAKPLPKILCMNSGSEAMTVGLRLTDVSVKSRMQRNPDIKPEKLRFIALQNGFHGRTDRPSQISSSCLSKYQKNLASFSERKNLRLVEVNNIAMLEKCFQEIKEEGCYVEALAMEPVMGEGNPGVCLQPEYYKRARELTKENDCLLIIDSVQAGLRAHGCLSVVDYPGFQELDPPDMEAFSKALNAGQYPLSVLAMTDKTAALYKTGIYGNTMTSNPKALAVGCSVLKSVSSKIRSNIRERGKEAVELLQELSEKYPQAISSVQGTGLLFAAAIKPEFAEVLSAEGLEVKMRRKGIGVIHGGENSLRFTPVFDISSDELKLIFEIMEQVLREENK